MNAIAQHNRARVQAEAAALFDAIETAEQVIVSSIERECEALRAGRWLAAKALHTRLCDVSRVYLDTMKAAQASLWSIEKMLPGSRARLDERRAAFSSVLKVELAVLATARAAALASRNGGKAEAGESGKPGPQHGESAPNSAKPRTHLTVAAESGSPSPSGARQPLRGRG